MADISPAGAGSSVRVAYYSRYPEFAKAVEAWTQGDYSVCPFG